MRGKVLAILSAAVLVAAVPQPARFDQRQTGTYNFHLNLQDGQVYAVVKDVLVSAPVGNFAVTLKGPIVPPTTESPRTDGRIGLHPQTSKGGIPSSILKTPIVAIPQSLKGGVSAPETLFNMKTPYFGNTSKTSSVEVQPNSKVTLTGVPPKKESNFKVAAAVGSPPSNQPNGTSNSRRQNNKVASQIINQQAAELMSSPPPPPPVQAAKPTLSPLPPLPHSIIAALTDQRSTNHRIQALPDQVNEINNVRNSQIML